MRIVSDKGTDVDSSHVLLPDPVDDSAGRLPGSSVDADDAGRRALDDIAADNRILGPVGAFDEHVRLEHGDEIVGRFLVEDHDTVDTRECLDQLGTLRFRGAGRPGP